MSTLTLLFDSDCARCSSTARAAEEESAGALSVRSLRDPEIRALLDRHRPGWSWRPMLVVEDGSAVKVLAGAAMLRKLVSVLGTRRSWVVMSSVVRESGGAPAAGMSRRTALRGAGGTVLAVAGIAMGAKFAAAQPPSGEDDPTISGAELDELVRRTTQSADGRSAINEIAAAGYDTGNPHGAAFADEAGGTVTMVFYPSTTNEETEAAALIQEASTSGAVRTKIEYVRGDLAAEERAGDELLSSLQVESGSQFGAPGLAARGKGEYISCLAFCVGGSCGANALRCRAALFMAAVLACMVAVCGSKVRGCHGSCQRLW